MPTKIRANSVLPAHREAVTLHTADGLSLVAELAVPLDRPPVATIICLHPLPTHGGMMDSHVYRKAAFRLPALAGIAVLRFNTRGTWSAQGTSEGSFDHAVGEQYDVAAAIEYAEFHDLPDVWLVGWSFGTDLALMHGLDPVVTGAILLSPPLRFSDPEHLAAVGGVGQAGDRPGARARRLPAAGGGAGAVRDGPAGRGRGDGGCQAPVRSGDAERVLDEIVRRVAPQVSLPLPREWDGPMETADTSAYNAHHLAAYRDVPVSGPAGLTLQRRAPASAR